MVTALNVVRAGVQTAANSYSQASGGSQTNNSSNNTSSNNVATGSTTASSGGISTSSSPSASDQFASATQQSNQVLSMSNDNVDGTIMSITPLPTFDNSASIAIADVQVQSVQGEIDTAMSGVMTSSEADQIADQIIAANIEAQQEEIEQQQQETGEYADESKLIALIGYVPSFNNYTQVTVPDAQDWYSSSDIYTSATLNDNTSAFYGLVNDNLKGLDQMINDQPNMWR